MITLTTKKLAEILEAKLVGDESVEIESISTDSRQPMTKGLFFALKGERFDAHQYLHQAVAQGATALVVKQAQNINQPQLVVADTKLALGKLAHWLRLTINPHIVAITGSSGKTTVKEMTASILQQTAVDPDAVLFTQGNFNNEIGVPLTLARLTKQHKFAVIELGANHQGEIDYTTKLVQPEVALVNNVAEAHLAGFGSLQGVAQAKGEIYRGLTKNGVALINAEHNYLSLWQEEIGKHPIEYFNGKDYYAKNIQLSENGSDFEIHSPKGHIHIHLAYLGEHNIKNALAATALAMNVGASLQDVQTGLQQCGQVKGRLFPMAINENLLLLDDSYNANVCSFKSAIDVLKNYAAFRILVVGDMYELGENSAQYHQQIADYATQAQLDLILSIGTETADTFGKISPHFQTKNELVAYVKSVIDEKLAQNQKVVLLAKGSRGMKMEQIIDALKDSFQC